MVIKPLNFVQSRSYETPTFYLGMYSIPKVSCYTYLGIPFSDDLSLQPVISNMQSKVRKSLFSFSNFLLNNMIPLTLKTHILQSYIISKALYYSPLLGSNKTNTRSIQSLINTGMLWCIGSSHKIQ